MVQKKGEPTPAKALTGVMNRIREQLEREGASADKDTRRPLQRYSVTVDFQAPPVAGPSHFPLKPGWEDDKGLRAAIRGWFKDRDCKVKSITLTRK